MGGSCTRERAIKFSVEENSIISRNNSYKSKTQKPSVITEIAVSKYIKKKLIFIKFSNLSASRSGPQIGEKNFQR